MESDALPLRNEESRPLGNAVREGWLVPFAHFKTIFKFSRPLYQWHLETPHYTVLKLKKDQRVLDANWMKRLHASNF